MRKLPYQLLLCLTAPILTQCGNAAAVEGLISDSVPGVVFPALCAAFAEEEGFDYWTTTIVLRETRPVFNTFALRILHDVGEMTPAEADQDDARDEELKADLVPIRVELPEDSGPCRWQLAERPAAEYFGTRALLLELSNLVTDPFATADGFRYGLFARWSNGGAFGAAWYWVALRQVGKSWEVARVFLLEISDG